MSHDDDPEPENTLAEELTDDQIGENVLKSGPGTEETLRKLFDPDNKHGKE